MRRCRHHHPHESFSAYLYIFRRRHHYQHRHSVSFTTSSLPSALYSLITSCPSRTWPYLLTLLLSYRPPWLDIACSLFPCHNNSSSIYCLAHSSAKSPSASRRSIREKPLALRWTVAVIKATCHAPTPKHWFSLVQFSITSSSSSSSPMYCYVILHWDWTDWAMNHSYAVCALPTLLLVVLVSRYLSLFQVRLWLSREFIL